MSKQDVLMLVVVAVIAGLMLVRTLVDRETNNDTEERDEDE